MKEKWEKENGRGGNRKKEKKEGEREKKGVNEDLISRVRKRQKYR